MTEWKCKLKKKNQNIMYISLKNILPYLQVMHISGFYHINRYCRGKNRIWYKLLQNATLHVYLAIKTHVDMVYHFSVNTTWYIKKNRNIVLYTNTMKHRLQQKPICCYSLWHHTFFHLYFPFYIYTYILT